VLQIYSHKPELLMPAGNPDLLKTAFRYGADAVYVGGEEYSLRAKAKNFSMQELSNAVDYAHGIDKKVYVTANIYALDTDLPGISHYIKELAQIKPDALIIADSGVFEIAKEFAPNIPIHISTQANITNSAAVKFWHRQGAKRVVLARELTLREMAAIRSAAPEDVTLEAFAHGAMCVSYSGRCLLSAYFTRKSANAGLCTHPCRWRYALMEESRPGQYLPIEEAGKGTLLLSSNDVCMIEHIPDILRAGIDSLKVEGRMKNALYIASVARAYRMAIDAALCSSQEYESILPFVGAEVQKCSHRDFSTGFYFSLPMHTKQGAGGNTDSSWVYLGTFDGKYKDNACRWIQKNKFKLGDSVEILKPDGENVCASVLNIRNDKGDPVECAPHAKESLWVEFSARPEAGDVLRMRGS